MGCDGKCYLMSQLAASSEAEKPVSSDKKDAPVFEIIDLFFADLTSYDYLIVENNIRSTLNSFYNNLYCNPNSWSFFHPPINTF